MKLTATHLRIGLLVLNLVLTLLIGGQALYAVFDSPDFPKLNHWPDPDDLKDTGVGPVKNRDMVTSAVSISRGLEPRPPEIAKGPDEKVKVDDVAPPAGPGELPPGPLDENGWELSLCIVTDDPQANWCVLQKKDPTAQAAGGAKPSPATSRISSRTVRPPIRVPGGKIQRIPGQGPPTDKRTLRVKDQWLDEEQKINIWVIDVKRNRMVYEDGNNPKRPQYALVKKPVPYIVQKDGVASLKKVEEPPPDPNVPEAKTEKEVHFHAEPIDRDGMFEKRKEAASMSAGTAVKASPAAGPNAAHPANQPSRPPSRDELKQIGQTMGELKTNEKFQKALKDMNEKDRKMLESLGGAK